MIQMRNRLPVVGILTVTPVSLNIVYKCVGLKQTIQIFVNHYIRCPIEYSIIKINS